ncbi:Ig-like domain-containing protein [Taibaiella koreensis]|uniref:Ig-like domain-containing protein n=1 Tax=Taibaiella koreensis TaxID=1268548 RepID=UPI000E5992E0|nr:PKD domain-containing protein [Taibaiella koreensis]
MKSRLLFASLLALSTYAAQAAYVPLPITTGFTADVVANGTGTVMATTSADVDGANFSFMAIGWQQTSTSTPVTFGLPASGVISSAVAATPGLNFNIGPSGTPYTGNNSLRIATNGTSGTLVFASNPTASNLFILATSGSGNSYFTGQINFTDATNQPISTAIVVPDWFSSTLQPVAASGFGRVGYLSNLTENPSGNPRLYQITIPINTANQTKQIASIQITKATTSAAGSVLNVFAASVETVVTCAAPTSPTATSITPTTAVLDWAQTGTPGQWQIKYGPTGFPVATGGTSIFTSTKPYTLNPPLTPSTGYSYYVRAVCGANDTSLWTPVTNFTTTCNAPAIVSKTDSFNCGTGAVTLKASTVAGASIKWYAALTGGTALITGNIYTTGSISATTTYYIAAASGTCESSPRQAVVATIRPIPTVNIGNDTTICPGITYTLNATTTGGTYAWNTGATTPTITVNTAGTYSVAVTVNSCSGSDARVITPGIVPVNVQPAVTDLCSGSTATLNAGNAGSTFLWTPGSNTTQTINVTAGGTYTAQIKSTNGCVINSSTNVIIRPLPVPALGNDTSICDGAQITLDAGNAGYTFLWNTAATTQTIAITDSGTYSVTVTTPYSCVQTEDRHIAYLPSPRAEGFNFIPLFYEDLGKVKFSPLNPTDVDSYEWDFGDGSPKSTQMTPMHTYAATGSYDVTLKVYNNCADYSISQPLKVDLVTGIIKLGKDEANVLLYPNPSRDQLFISNKSAVKMQEVMVFNTLGALVYRHKADNDKQHQLSVSGMAAGVYSVRILTDKGFVIRKFEVLR